MTADTNNNRTPVINGGAVHNDNGIEITTLSGIHTQSQRASSISPRPVGTGILQEQESNDNDMFPSPRITQIPDTINNVIIDQNILNTQSNCAISRLNRSCHSVTDQTNVIESVIEEEIFPADDVANESVDLIITSDEQSNEFNKEEHHDNTGINNRNTTILDHNNSSTTTDEPFKSSEIDTDLIVDTSKEVPKETNQVEPGMKIFGVIGSLMGTNGDSVRQVIVQDTRYTQNEEHHQNNTQDNNVLQRKTSSPETRSTEDDGYQSMADTLVHSVEQKFLNISIPEVDTEGDTMFSGAPRDLGLRGGGVDNKKLIHNTGRYGRKLDDNENEGRLDQYIRIIYI